MLEYEWGNPSSIMLSEDQPGQDPEPNRPIFDPYIPHNFSEPGSFVNPPENHFNHHIPFHHHPQNPNSNTHFSSYYDSRAYGASASSYPHPQAPSMLTLEPAGPTGYMMVPKTEPMAAGLEYNGAEFNSRIGLNLGGRTYFASSEDDFVNRLYRRSRILEPGSVNSPMCQAEGCNADLSHAKHYHRRHKVCEFHSKAATVIAAGLTQRFCQQCSRFHLLTEFDNGKRSCRKRLADHNRRRRKSQQSTNQENSNKAENNAPNSSSETLARSPPDSGPISSSVTIALSPPRISLDCFGHRSNSTASTSSLFYSND